MIKAAPEVEELAQTVEDNGGHSSVTGARPPQTTPRRLPRPPRRGPQGASPAPRHARDRSRTARLQIAARRAPRTRAADRVPAAQRIDEAPLDCQRFSAGAV